VQEATWQSVAAAQVGEAWSGVVEDRARHQAQAGEGLSWRVRTANNRKIILHGGEYEVGDRVRARITGFRNTTFLGEARE
jgi:hypothetical protein